MKLLKQIVLSAWSLVLSSLALRSMIEAVVCCRNSTKD